MDSSLGIETVTDCLYRGFCRSPEVTQYVRQEFIDKESIILATIDQHSSMFEAKQVKSMKEYLNEFFTTLKDDKHFKVNAIEH